MAARGGSGARAQSEVVVVALAVPYRSKLFKPRAHAPIGELVGLEDLGRALPWTGEKPEGGTELGQVAGEIRDEAAGRSPGSASTTPSEPSG